MTEPKTFAEQLDAAQTGEEFQAILMRLFVAAFDQEGEEG
jgi:hypothetical protein